MQANNTISSSNTAFINTAQSADFTQRWLTAREAAEQVRVSVETIYDECAKGHLAHSRIAKRRSIRIKPEWLDSWMVAQSLGGTC